MRPWTRVHVDQWKSRMILVIVDSHSGWVEAIPTPSATTAATVEESRTVFARFGLPVYLVTDNGTSFTGVEFQDCAKKWHTTHSYSIYKPQSNGLAERAVRSVKEGLKRMTGGKPYHKIGQVVAH
ncbi:uncharacterized protein K02A2.6-like [Rhipicephalus sanguineus]|uniref:uncharacterized protein K02A2.6-like n=1 Tax=Rhipicephalus sanguineus TaxID=34632 RepID=UPI00189501D0|nr:uncharacterized protein K02A2.6-like [Rhipicephalus sanguineus]